MQNFLLSIYYDSISEMHSIVRNPDLASVSFDCVKPKCVRSKLTMTNLVEYQGNQIFGEISAVVIIL